MDEVKIFYDRIAEIQLKLKAAKGQYNSFGKYKYRSCEDILEAVKILLNGLVLTVNDEIVQIGTRYYVKATAEITDGIYKISNSAYAREEEDKKGMDASQITGACSSYARKYALNGLLCIDDTKDADTKDNRQNNNKAATETSTRKPTTTSQPSSQDKDEKLPDGEYDGKITYTNVRKTKDGEHTSAILRVSVGFSEVFCNYMIDTDLGGQYFYKDFPHIKDAFDKEEVNTLVGLGVRLTVTTAKGFQNGNILKVYYPEQSNAPEEELPIPQESFQEELPF